jgi:hypothetical protein
MKVVWLLVITPVHGGVDQPEYPQQLAIPHKCQTEENCISAGCELYKGETRKNFRILDYAPHGPALPDYRGEAGMKTGYIPIMVDRTSPPAAAFRSPEAAIGLESR